MPVVLPLPALRQLVESIAAQPPLWFPAVHFDPERRFWARLPSDPGVDVWLLTWLPDQSTELHDHGGSSAAVAVVHGELSELRADPKGRVTRHRRLPGRTLGLAPGVVHDLEHAGDRSAVSIHAYSPPATTLSQVCRPPRLLGTTWSMLAAAAPQ